jgi:hypothetical protein
MLSERGKILVIFENLKSVIVEARKKVLYIFFFVNKWFVENLLYYLVFIIAFKHRWGRRGLGPTITYYLYFIKGLTESGVRRNRAQVLTTTWVASAQSYHRLKTTQVIRAYTENSCCLPSVPSAFFKDNPHLNIIGS